MAQDKVFTKGLVVKAPRENAPSFVKGTLAIKVDEFVEFLQQHKKSDGWVNLDILQARDGMKWYCAVNEWKKSEADKVVDKMVEEGEIGW